MPLISVPVAVGADDGRWEPAGSDFQPTLTTAAVGRTGTGNIRNVWLRFQDVPLPTGQIILSARIRMISGTNQSGTCNLTVAGEDADNPTAPSDTADADGRTRTTAEVAWNNVQAWVDGEEYVTPNIATVIQEIADRPGWAENNTIQLFVEDNVSDNAGVRSISTFENGSFDAAELEINYVSTIFDTGWVNFGDFTGNGGWLTGSTAARTWLNPGNAASSDDVYATRSLSALQASAVLAGTNVGLSIPTDADILGIQFRAEASKTGANTANITRVGLTKNGTSLAGSEKLVAQNLTTDAYFEWGSDSDLWDTTWTAAELNATGFGGGLFVGSGSSGSATAQVDHMQIRVHYTSMANLFRAADVSVALQSLGIERDAGVSAALLAEFSRDANVSTALTALGITRTASITTALLAEASRQADVSAALKALNIERDAGVTIALGAEESLNLPITTGDDDGYYNPDTAFFNTTNTSLIFGEASGPRDTFLRFQNVTAPPGTVLNSARLRVQAEATRGGTVCNILIVAEDSDNPAAPIDVADANGRTRTAASVAWNNVEAFTVDQEYFSSDFALVLNEVFARPGWVSGNSILLFLEDNGSDVAAHRRVASFEHATLEPVVLELTWTPIFQRNADVSVALQALGLERDANVSTALKAFNFQRNAAVSMSLELAAFTDLTRTASIEIALRPETRLITPGRKIDVPPEFTLVFTGPLPDDKALVRMGLPRETDLQFSSELPGGWSRASAGVTRPELRRTLNATRYQALSLPENLTAPAFAHGSIYDEGGEVVWEGRISNRHYSGGEIRGATMTGYGITGLKDTRMPPGSGKALTPGVVRRVVDASSIISPLELSGPNVSWDWSGFNNQLLYNVMEALSEAGCGTCPGWTWTVYHRRLRFFGYIPPDTPDYIVPNDETVERSVDNEEIYTRVILSYTDLNGETQIIDVRNSEAEKRFGISRELPISGGQMTASAATAYARTELIKRSRINQAVTITREWNRGLETPFGSKPAWRVRAGEWVQIGESEDMQPIESISYSQRPGAATIQLGLPVSDDTRSQWRRLMRMETALRTNRNTSTRT